MPIHEFETPITDQVIDEAARTFKAVEFDPVNPTAIDPTTGIDTDGLHHFDMALLDLIDIADQQSNDPWLIIRQSFRRIGTLAKGEAPSNLFRSGCPLHEELIEAVRSERALYDVAELEALNDAQRRN